MEVEMHVPLVCQREMEYVLLLTADDLHVHMRASKG